MIQLTHFSGGKFYLNAEMIQSVESTPDTLITLSNSQKLLVKDKVEDVIRKVLEYQRIIHNPQVDIEQGV
ncbi:MAG: flagellar FlbD family protein [Anaerolineae bacterium]|nr:flagellar FlbD family protein [Anaerolineae bacterium]